MKKENGLFKSLKLIYSLDKALLFICAMLAVFSSFYPFINIILSAQILSSLSANAPMQTLLLLVFALIGFNALVSLCITGLENLLEYRTELFLQRYEKAKTEKFMRIKFEYFESSTFESIRQKIRFNDRSAGTMRNILNEFTAVVSMALGLVISVFIIKDMFVLIIKSTFGVSWPTIALVVMAIVSIVLIVAIQRKSEEKMPGYMDELGHTNRMGMYLVEAVVHDYRFGKDLRIFRVSNLVLDELNKMLDAFRPIYLRILNANNMPGAVATALSAIIGGVVYILVAIYAMMGVFSVGDVVLYAGSIHRLITSATALVFAVGTLRIQVRQLESVFELFSMKDSPPQMAEHPDATPKEACIEFEHVSFQYPDSDRFALKDISFTLHAGERLAIVGVNGSGKTTMIKLLCRLYTPSEGRILFGGVDIQLLQDEEYHKALSVLFQDFHLFAFSVAENVAMADEYDGQKIMDCLEKTGIAQHIERTTMGIETPLFKNFDENGIEMSGGEQQRIAIARLAYRSTPFVILDEPTAALDPVAEFDIYSNFDAITKGSAVVYVSHRLSSCRFCDRVLVFNEGKIVQRGSHEQLLAEENGEYSHLWKAQAQYYV